jgi:hypothetical protein
MGEEVESHGYRLGSPLASVVGMAERVLERRTFPRLYGRIFVRSAILLSRR